MKRVIFLTMPLLLGACAGNLDTSAKHGPKPPPMRQARFVPGAAYGSSEATWAPPVYDRNGTIVAPRDPRNDTGRESYEKAPWATGAQGQDASKPAGTF